MEPEAGSISRKRHGVFPRKVSGLLLHEYPYSRYTTPLECCSSNQCHISSRCVPAGKPRNDASMHSVSGFIGTSSNCSHNFSIFLSLVCIVQFSVYIAIVFLCRSQATVYTKPLEMYINHWSGLLTSWSRLQKLEMHHDSIFIFVPPLMSLFFSIFCFLL